MATLKLQLTGINRGFWLQWVLATAIGWMFGFILCETIVEPFLKSLIKSVEALGGGAGAIIGIGIGVAQWLVLRRHLGRIKWWAFATIIGWAIGKALADY